MKYQGTWRAKGIADGAETLDEIIERLETEVKGLRELSSYGVRLASPVEDDYGPLETTNPAGEFLTGFEVAGKYRLEEK